MNFQLEKPEAVIKAQEMGKGLNWFLEILVFMALLFACTIGQIAVLVPGQILLPLLNSDYRTAVMSGDQEQIAAVMNEIGNSDMGALISLFSTIAMILIVMLFCKLFQKRTPGDLGFTRKGAGKEYLIGLGVGFVLFSLAILICVLTGALKFDGLSGTFEAGTFLLFFLGFMIQGMSEEVLCRGYLLISIGRRYSMWIAVFSNALVFAVLHLANPGISILAIINLTLFGVFASLYYIKRGNIWGIGAFHAIWNLAQGNFYGCYVSGVITKCSIFRSVMVEDGSIINGGTFGPEGGLAVTAVFLIGIFFLIGSEKVFSKRPMKSDKKRESAGLRV